MDLQHPGADDRSESLNGIVRRVDKNNGSTGHLLQMLSNFPSSQSTVTTDTQWRPPSDTTRRSVHVPEVSSQLRRRHEEYESFKQRFNRLTRRHPGPAAADDFSLRRRRDTRHQQQQNFDDSLTVITYNSDTNFTDFSTDKTQRSFGTRLHQARERFNSDSWHGIHRLSANSKEAPQAQANPFRRLQDDDLVLSQDQLSLSSFPPSAPKLSNQESLSRPDIKGKGKMIHPPSPAVKGFDRPVQTSPPQQPLIDDNMDEFEYDYGNDNYSASPQKPDAIQRDMSQQIEHDFDPLDDNMVDDGEETAGNNRGSQPTDSSNIKRNERVSAQFDEELIDVDFSKHHPIKRVIPGQTSTARLIEEVEKHGSTDLMGTFQQKYGVPVLGKTKVRKLLALNSTLKPMSSTDKVLTEASELYFNQLVEDLVTYSDHAGSQSVTMQDVQLLMARQGFLKEKSVESLAHQYLSREHWDKVCVSALADNVLYPDRDL